MAAADCSECTDGPLAACIARCGGTSRRTSGRQYGIRHRRRSRGGTAGHTFPVSRSPANGPAPGDCPAICGPEERPRNRAGVRTIRGSGEAVAIPRAGNPAGASEEIPMSDSMNNVALYDELDQAIDQLLAAPDAAFTHPEPNVGELVELASDLRYLPGANFKTRLRLELEWEAAGRTVSAAGDAHQLSHAGHAAKVAIESRQILPSLFGKTWAGYPMKRVNFALSVALHGVMALVMGAGFLMVKS